MIGTHKILTLCGSTRFKDDFEQAAKWLTLSGKIVLMPAVWTHSDPWCNRYITDCEKEKLDEIHLRKIDMSDGIYVINPGNYIGESTKNEIRYALIHKKEIQFMYDYTIKSKNGKPHIELYLSEILGERL